MVAREIVGHQEQKHAAAALIADCHGLRRVRGPGEQKAALGAARRRHHDPAFLLIQPRIFAEHEAELADIERQRLVVIANNHRSQA